MGPLTKQETQAHVIRADKLEPYSTTEIPVTTYRHLAGMADRLAQYERDLHDDIGKDRSQDTDWLRAGFLQRGAQIERLEDGIRALADQLEKEAYEAVPEDYAKRNLHRKYIASDCEAGGKDDAAERLRALLHD